MSAKETANVMKVHRPRRLSALAAMACSALSLHANEDALAAQARAAMSKATTFMESIAAEGGYLWTYSPDLKQRAGELPATETEIWVQPPGTPAMGMAFLRAHEVTGERRYLDAARAAAYALAVGQLESGGWDYVINFDPQQITDWYHRTDVTKLGPDLSMRRKNVSTFDDDTTQSALGLLLAVADATRGSTDPRDAEIREARDYAIAKILALQRPNGGWPQRFGGWNANPVNYPVRAAAYPKDYPKEYPRYDYTDYYTLNDGAQRDCIMVFLDAAQRLNRPELRAAALKGADFFLQAQMPEPQPVWALQYNQQMEPAWARVFEPPSVCSLESSSAIRLLVDVYLETGDEKYLEPIPRAIAWFERSQVEPGVWARMYELKTNRPVYGDRDGRIHYRLDELSLARQRSYGWHGSFGIRNTIAYYNEVKQLGRTAYLEKKRSAEAAGRAERGKLLEPRVREILGSLDEQGRWIVDFRGTTQIRTQTFIQNLGVLCDFIEAGK